MDHKKPVSSNQETNLLQQRGVTAEERNSPNPEMVQPFLFQSWFKLPWQEAGTDAARKRLQKDFQCS